MRDINLLVIHCAATTSSMDIGRAEIDEWHKAKGWSGIGYHYVIRRDGTLETGREESVVGAHAQGHNAKSIGICMVGGVEKTAKGKLITNNNFTPTQWTTLLSLVKKLQLRYPNAKLTGHRDLDSRKDCPSFSVREWAATNKLTPGVFGEAEHAPPAKPLAATKTVVGASLVGVGTVASAVTDTAHQVSAVAGMSDILNGVFVGLTVTGVALTLYGRLSIRKRTGV